jgi:hypothetical protein
VPLLEKAPEEDSGGNSRVSATLHTAMAMKDNLNKMSCVASNWRDDGIETHEELVFDQAA